MRIRFVPAVIALALAGLFGAVDTASAEPANTATMVNRSHVPFGDTAFYQIDVSEEDIDFDTGAPLTRTGTALLFLMDRGAIGAVNDTEDAVYAPIGWVVDLGDGTVTVTLDGLAFCNDSTTRRCTGGEFLTDQYLAY